VIPDVGQVELHVGVAVKTFVPPEATEGEVGDTATEFRVMGGARTVITVDVPAVFAPSVAFTYRPTVPAMVPAVKLVVLPLVGLIEPSVELVRAHTYVIPEGHVALHVGVAVKF
jgi:hypothetical protein